MLLSQKKMSFYLKKLLVNKFRHFKTLIGEKIELRLEKNYLNDKIVLIKNADPGYDFIFNYKIKGLITMYGGSNSHMAIRCLEQDILQSIGILKYQQILKSKKSYLIAIKEIIRFK